MEANFITGKTDIDTGWDSYIAQLHSLGLDDMCAIYQAAYDRYAQRSDQL